MSGIHLVLFGVAAFGFLPLIIILYKKNRVKKILTTGIPAKATVYNVYPVHRQPTDIVYYSFYVGFASHRDLRNCNCIVYSFCRL